MDQIDTLLREAFTEVPVAPGGIEQTMRRVATRRRRRARARAGAVGLSLAAVAATAVIALSGRTPEASATTVEVPGRILDAVGTNGGLWALTCTNRCNDVAHSVGRLVAIDARTGHIDRSVIVHSPQAVAAAGDSVWTVDFWDGTVTRYSARTGSELATVSLTLPSPVAGSDTRFLPAEISASEDGVWVATARGYVAQIDPATNRVVAMIKTTADATGPVDAGAGATWVGEGLELGRIDPATQTLSRMTIDGPGRRRLSIGALSVIGGNLWVSGEWAQPSRDTAGHEDWTITDEAVLAEIDPDTGKVRSLSPLPRGTTVRGDDDSSVWLARPRASRIFQFSPTARRIVASANVRATGAIVPAGAQSVWVARSAREFKLVKLIAR